MDHSYTQIFVEDENMNDQLDQFEANMEKRSDKLLIDAMRRYPHLYNFSLKEYKDVQIKENSWSEIALFINMSEIDGGVSVTGSRPEKKDPGKEDLRGKRGPRKNAETNQVTREE